MPNTQKYIVTITGETPPGPRELEVLIRQGCAEDYKVEAQLSQGRTGTGTLTRK